MEPLRAFRRNVSGLFENPHSRMLMLFGMEGLLLQFSMSLAASNGFGTNIYATNLGATDSQIGMIQLVANLFAVALLLPMGIISDRTKSAKTMPMAIMVILGVMFFFFGSVPMMGAHRMVFFFIFLCGTAGMLAIYNSIWQAFFGDVTPIEQRNRVYAFRNRFIYIIGTAAPVVCGMLLGLCSGVTGKLRVLQGFYYACGALSLVNAFVLSRIPGGRRTPEMLARLPKVSPRSVAMVLKELFRDRRFVKYFVCVMFFYFTWHIDWSVWYLGQTQYVGMSEAQLSVYSALVSIGQFLGTGVYVRMIERKGVLKTFLHPLISLVFAPVIMFLSLWAVQWGLGPAALTVLATLAFLPQCALNLCLVQMLLQAIPERNRSLIVSLNMAFVTLSNALMPFLGVQLYRLFGADRRAFICFELVMLALHSTALAIYAVRARRETRPA